MFAPSGTQAMGRGASRLIALFLFAVGSVFCQSNVSIQFGSNGLSSLKHNGIEYLSYGDPRLDMLQFTGTGGQLVNGDVSGSISVDATNRRVTRTSSWGAMVLDYTPGPDRLTVAVTIRNNSAEAIQGIWFEPLGLHFPSSVSEYNGSIPLIVNTVGRLAVQPMSYSGGTMILVAEDVAKPLQIGFPWAFDGNRSTFPLTLNTGRVSSLPDSYPLIKRPIPAHASDSFTFSLRFGPAGSTKDTLAGDMYGRYAAVFPQTLNWPDRRAIGALFVSTADTKYPNNPRGFFLDPNLNVFTPAGKAELWSRMMAYADYSIGVLKSMNAQGMIMWDIEGQQFPHAISYVCDPRQVGTLAPEIDGITDAFFKKFRDAGLKVGVCLRPQDFRLAADGKSAQQVSVDDPTALLMDKVRYAHDRWGATIFYVDSNVNEKDPNPTDAEVFAQLLAAFPDVLFIPEHQNLRYYAYTAPYDELRQGVTTTSADVRAVYPKAFTTIYTADGPLSEQRDNLVNSVKKGDVLLFRGWFEDPQNAIVKTIYALAGQQPPPTVNWISPAAGAILDGTKILAASASGSGGIRSVQFKLDGSGIGVPATSPPYQVTLDTTTVLNGGHTLTVEATDEKGVSTASSINVTVQNVQLPPLSSNITSPSQGQQVSNMVTVQAAVTGASGNARVQFQVDGANVGQAVTAAPYQINLDTKTLTNGSHKILATATDNAGRWASATRDVMVSNVVQPTCPGPASQTFTGCYYNDLNFSNLALVRNTSAINYEWGMGAPDPALPADIFTVRWEGNFTFAAGSYEFRLTSDDGSRLWVDGQLIVDDWGIHAARLTTRTIALTAGVHLVQLAYMEQYERAMVQLTWAATGQPLRVTMTAPSAGAQLSGQVHLTADASSSSGVTGVQFLLNGDVVGPKLTAAPYDYVLDTSTLQNGSATFAAIAWDASGANLTSTGVTATIANAPPPAPPTPPITPPVTPPVTPPTTPTVGGTCSGAGSEAFLGCYFRYRDLSNLAFTRTDPKIDFPWGYQTLAPGVGPENFSVRWIGDFTMQAGTYEFTMISDDGSRLFIDDREILNMWYEHPAIPVTTQLTLTPGVHRIRMEYFQMGGNATVKLTWVKK